MAKYRSLYDSLNIINNSNQRKAAEKEKEEQKKLQESIERQKTLREVSFTEASGMTQYQRDLNNGYLYKDTTRNMGLADTINNDTGMRKIDIGQSGARQVYVDRINELMAKQDLARGTDYADRLQKDINVAQSYLAQWDADHNPAKPRYEQDKERGYLIKDTLRSMTPADTINNETGMRKVDINSEAALQMYEEELAALDYDNYVKNLKEGEEKLSRREYNKSVEAQKNELEDAIRGWRADKDAHELASYDALKDNPDYFTVARAALDKYREEQAAKEGKLSTVPYDASQAYTQAIKDVDEQIQNMSSAQQLMYFYLLETRGKDSADRYRELIKRQVWQNMGNAAASQLRDAGLGGIVAPVAGLESAVTGLLNTGAMALGEDAVPTTPMQTASQNIRSGLGTVGGALYDTAYTVGNMAPSIALSVMLGGAGIPLKAASAIGSLALGSSAAGNAYAEGLERGYSPKQATAYGLLTGASEAALGYALGGIGQLGLGNIPAKASNALKGALQSIVANPRVAGALANILGNAGSEFTEEYLQEILTPVFQNLAGGENNDIKLFSEEALYAGILGALTGGLFEGVNVGSTTARMGALPMVGATESLTVPETNTAIFINEQGQDAYNAYKTRGTDFDKGFASMYNLGKEGKGFSATETGSKISRDAQYAAYRAGLQDYKAANQNAKVQAAQDKVNNLPRGKKFKYGSLTIETAPDYTMTDADKRNAKLLKVLANNSSFKMVFHDTLDGNGFYDPTDNTIHIAMDSDKPVINVLSHELTHSIKEWSPARFNELQSYIQQYYEERGQLWDSLVTKKMTDYGAQGINLDYDGAVEEVIADASEMFLYEKTAIQQLAESNPTLGNRVKAWVEQTWHRLRDAAKGVNPRSAEAILLAENAEVYRKALEMWSEALGETSQVAGYAEGSADTDGVVKYSLNPEFVAKYDAWDGNDAHTVFTIGTTSEALKSIGVKDSRILWDGSKIKKIKEKHPAMTDNIIKQVPSIIEHPVLVMQSKQLDSCIVMFGEVFDENDVPVLAVLELNPTIRGQYDMEIIKIASAYGKDTNPQRLINTSRLLYVDANKNRTNSWLKRTRLQLPFKLQQYGSIAMISYPDTIVKNSTRSAGKNDTKHSLRTSADPMADLQKFLADPVAYMLERNPNAFNYIAPQTAQEPVSAEVDNLPEEAENVEQAVNEEGAQAVVEQEEAEQPEAQKESTVIDHFINLTNNIRQGKGYNLDKVYTRDDVRQLTTKNPLEYTEDDIFALVSGMSEKSRKGLYLKDVSRVLDSVAGGDREIRQALFNLIEKPFNNAGGQYGRQSSEMLSSFKKQMNELGIKFNSTEDRDTIRYGQGYYVGKDGEVVRYTLEDLKRDHPDNWEKIIEADKLNRRIYDDYLENINAMRERIYPQVLARAEADLENATARHNDRIAQRDEQSKLIKTIETRISKKEALLAAKKSTTSQAYADLKNSIANDKRLLQNAQNKMANIERRVQNAKFKMDYISHTIESGQVLAQKKIVPRKDYYHHVMEITSTLESITNLFTKKDSTEGVNGLSILEQLMVRDKGRRQDISPGMVGISDNTKPKVKWEGILEHRKGMRYRQSAFAAMADYIPAAEYMLAYDPVTSSYRTIQNTIRAAAEQMNAKNANGFIEWLGDFTDNLTGKTDHIIDRGVQKVIGRNLMQGIKKINSIVKGSALIGNVRSMLVQGSSLANALNYVTNPKDWRRGILTAANAAMGHGEYASIMAQSNFMAQRNAIAGREIVPTISDKLKKPGLWMLSAGQNVADNIIWWTAYESYNNNPDVQKGMNRDYENAVDYADDVTRRSVAGRGVGEAPLVLQSNTINMLAPFQTEVLNQYNTITENLKGLMPGATKEQRRRAAIGILEYEVGAFAFNALARALFNDDVLGFDYIHVLTDALKDITDDEEDDVVQNAWYNFAGTTIEGIPFTSLIPYLMDEEQSEKLFGPDSSVSRYGTGLMGINAITETAGMLFDKEKADAWSIADTAASYIPYGRQAYRIAQGIDTLVKGGSYRTNPDGEEMLQFALPSPGEKGYIADAARTILFGKWASKPAQEYIDAGFPTLSADDTKAYKNAIGAGINGTDFLMLREDLRQKDAEGNGLKIADKRRLIMGADLSAEQKRVVDLGLLRSTYTDDNKAEHDWAADYSSETMFELSNMGRNVYEKAKEKIKELGITAEDALMAANYIENHKYEPIKDAEGNIQKSNTEQFREGLMADNSLTAEQKRIIDQYYTTDKYTADYTSAETFTTDAKEYERNTEWQKKGYTNAQIKTFNKWNAVNESFDEDKTLRTREKLMADTTLTAEQKAVIDREIIGNKFVYDYSSPATYAISSMGEGSYEKATEWVNAENDVHITYEQAQKILEFRKANSDGKGQKEKLIDYMFNTLNFGRDRVNIVLESYNYAPIK